MDCNERILIDIEKLDESFEKVESIKLSQEEKEIIRRAENYKEDCKYYLEKGDELTSFGCITYAHGLVDAILLNHHIN
ncbi:hypothetical protein MARBORIA2_00750 [Methanobrevibacter arboriphilus]|jgi:hypothetical protein|uniref:Uncharacterized protein n=1 Tax=Methanobrevibacter arboriphilus TaxID=39441 RepID=A0ACA8R2L7_METAZ|nr:DUF357 domain-containing protein [Methanobrevibacter arboriphilus]BBL61873.1 hypothetical protein MarbSA_09130 [Methanobrevibacter arboriphilus]GLI10985.1 hypothetical protein MARBORIA2_00750 [Methanobrevibacter arboriphilus]